MSEKMGEVSAMNRLKKAAALGFGPLMDRSEKPPATRSRSRSLPGRGLPSGGELSTSNSAVVAVREQQERRREALRQVLKGPEDEPDINGFLGCANTKKQLRLGVTALQGLKVSSGPIAVNANKLDLNLKISSGTSERVAAEASGARPKASAKAASKSKEAEELLQRQMEEKATQEFEEMQRAVRPQAREKEADVRYYDDESVDSSEEDRRWRKRDEKKKRDEWRKKRREEQKKSGVGQGKRSSESEGEEIDDEEKEARRKEREEAKQRAQTWRTINNNGRYSKVAGSYVGQLSDKELDKKIADAAKQNAASSLMSEAEVVAKMQKGKNAATGGARKKSRSRSANRPRYDP